MRISPALPPFRRPTSHEELLLDQFTSLAAFSLRKLRTAYTGSCIRVRRSSDSTEQDVGFVDNVLDTASLLTFCGAGNGFVTKWYNQYGSYDVSQSTAGNQPQIVASGVVETDGALPSIAFNNKSLVNGSPLAITSASTFAVFNQTVEVSYGVLSSSLFSDSYYRWLGDGNGYLGLFSSVRREQFPPSTPATGRQLYETFHTGSSLTAYINGVNKGTDTTQSFAAGDAFAVGHANPAISLTGFLSEVIVFDSDVSASRSAINANINNYWGVY